MKTRGIITSTVGKGYYVLNDAVCTEHRVFLLFDKLAAYKEILHESLKDALKGRGTEQIFFHSNNPQVLTTMPGFCSLIPAAAVHFSGKDSMVLEVNATPYIFTSKLWDWGRFGLDGKPCPIDIAHGKNVIQWNRTAN